MKIGKTAILTGLLVGALTAPTALAIAKDDHQFHIPPGHMPPPGMCRIWIPGRPPGHQPAPGSCRVLSRQVPRGAYLIANDDHRWSHVELNDRHFRHDVWDEPRYFYIPSGHTPPAGMCRIWIPGRPPSHQPAPGSCRVLSRQVPSGAYLIANDNHRWSHAELNDRHFRHDVWDNPRYTTRREIREDVRDVRQARKDVREDREQLEKNHTELGRDRAELRKDIRRGASKTEIAQDRREIREDAQKLDQNKRELRQSQDKLQSSRQELKDDLRRR